ncbi:MAG: TatD family hydrolase, partial [Prevotella bivia]|nr:TatD family hydrolase [Prevotella bivia]
MIIDTHAHLDVEDYSEDLPEVIARAKEAGVKKIFIPSIDLATVDSVIDICNQYPGYCYPMIGLHPEEVKGDYTEVLRKMKLRLNGAIEARKHDEMRIIAVGEVGLDFYWSREFEKEQILVFEEMMQWSMEKGLPLMIHCRKAQN